MEPYSSLGDDDEDDEDAGKVSRGDDDDDDDDGKFSHDDDDTESVIMTSIPKSIKDVAEDAVENAGHDSLGDHLRDVYLHHLDEEGYL